MNNKKILSFLFLIAVSCSKLPVKEEVEYRSRLENEIVTTFPKKLSIVIHPFADLKPKETNDAYLRQAIPDVIEGMLEPMKSTLAYIPFDNMPFYVSESLSNLFQAVQREETNTNLADTKTETNKSFFSYLTNYLIAVPIQVTQLQYDLTTNTNYFNIETNIKFEQGDSKTNFISNEVLQTTTNSITTNLVVENRNVITATNMLLLLYEEFPQLINYLSYIPIEVRRATEKDITAYEEYLEWAKDPKAWKKKEEKRKSNEKKKKEKESSTNAESADIIELTTEQIEEEKRRNYYPTEPFELIYHITGNYRSSQDNVFSTPDVDIRVTISELHNTGFQWWIIKNNTPPPSLSKVLKMINSIDTNNIEAFKKASLRLPHKREKISARLQEEFDIYSTNFREDRPTGATNNTLPEKNTFRIRIKEDKIPTELNKWLKVFHETFINRPHTQLLINTNPSDTLVYLNGFYIGKTPLNYPTAPLGEQRISFIKDGYLREEVLIDIKANKANRINFNLAEQNNSGILSINSSIITDVFIDSQFKGKTPLIISNLTLNKKFRVEVLNPSGILSNNRNSFYKSVILTTEKPNIDLDIEFKNYETSYKARGQKGLLIGTYISWITTFGILGVSIYTQARHHEFLSLSRAPGIPTSLRNSYRASADSFGITSQTTLYTAIVGAIISTGIMGWYLYSKEVYLGFDYNPDHQEVFANLKLKF
ncbi:MAG: PEGA domain-containing protein [Brevinema sp.]